MPPRVRVTREDILEAAMRIMRRDGAKAINARAVAAEIGCSTQPIFSNFDSIEELKDVVFTDAVNRYRRYLQREMVNPHYPLYKASGMGYIRFAEEEPQLFRELFMNRVEEGPQDRGWEVGVDTLMSSTGLDREEAEQFHTEMWIFVHGIAVMLATDFVRFSYEQICSMLTDVYTGLRRRYFENKEDAI